MPVWMLLFLGMMVGWFNSANAADPATPHPHQGVLAPYSIPPKAVSLTAAEEQQIRAGTPVMKQAESASGGRGVAVFVVNAPPAKVWTTIKSFHRYPSWISGVSACEVYKKEGNHIYVKFVLSKMGVNVEYYIDHTVGSDWITWRLDYSRTSDLDDSVGMWRVTPLPEDPNRSKVEYSVDLKVSSWVPGFVRSMIVDQGLQDATSWVKVQSEKP